ncbi:MAG: glycine zipper domain-containing protein [Chthoniobacterales bacterium]
MKKYLIPAVSAAILMPMVFTSCETPVGQSAGFGAATGAIIGGAATGRVRGAAIGAGAGALAGALIGAAIQEDQARYYHAPPEGYPYAQRTGTPGYVYSPYGRHNVIDVRGVPPGALVRDPSTSGIFRKP